MSFSPNKRLRPTFIWERFISENVEYGNFRATEDPNLALVDMMLDMNRDDPAVHRSYDNLRKYGEDLKRAGGSRVVVYQQKSFAKYKPVDGSYVGATSIGRAYTTSDLNQLPRKIVNTLYKSTHVEIDISQSYSSMLVNAFPGKTQAMQLLVDQPAATLASLQEECGATSQQIKRMVNSAICSYPQVSWGLDENEAAIARRFSQHLFGRGILRDLEVLSEALREEYPAYFEMIKNRAVQTDKMNHVDGLALSFLAQDMEHAVMRKAVEKLTNEAKPPLVWYYDGMILPAEYLGESITDAIDELDDFIQDEMNIDVTFKCKDLRENSLGISLSNQELDDSDGYRRWKTEFEKKFFRLDNPPVFCQVMPNGEILDLNQAQFTHNTMSQSPVFIAKWKSDATKREYVGKDFAPPPLQALPNHFNTYAGLEAEKWDPLDVEVDLEPYKNHVYILMGGDEHARSTEYANYFHKLIALKIQQPGSIWRVVPFLWSIQGAGKDVWFDFIGRILGSHNILKLPCLGDLIASSSLMESRLLVCISETNYQDTKANNDHLKDLVSAHEIVVKKKYVNSYKIRNACAIIAFSNNSDAFATTGDDRRLFPVRAAGKYANSPEYFQDLIPYLEKQETAKAVYDWYMAMDIEDFDPSGERPITEAFQELVTCNSNIMERTIMEQVEMWKSWVDSDMHPDVVRYHDKKNQVLRIPTSIFTKEYFQQTAIKMGIMGSENSYKMRAFQTKLTTEMVHRAAKYKTVEDMKAIIISHRSNGQKFKLIDYVGLKTYLETTSTEGQEADDTSGYAPGFNPGRQAYR